MLRRKMDPANFRQPTTDRPALRGSAIATLNRRVPTGRGNRHVKQAEPTEHLFRHALFERLFAVLRTLCLLYFLTGRPIRPLEECVVTLGGYGGNVFEVTPDKGMVIGAPLALTISPETGDSMR